MFDFLNHVWDDLHPIFNHFPIAFLVGSFLLAFARYRWAKVEPVEWFLFAWGALMCMPAAITGIMAHEAYESSPIHETIERHGLPANLGTLAMLGMLVWRYRTRKAEDDVGRKRPYLVFAALGLLWILFVGGTGGNLTYEHAINVRGVNPLP